MWFVGVLKTYNLAALICRSHTMWFVRVSTTNTAYFWFCIFFTRNFVSFLINKVLSLLGATPLLSSPPPPPPPPPHWFLQTGWMGGRGERRGVPPLWLAVLADGHLVRGPHWFLGGRPQNVRLCSPYTWSWWESWAVHSWEACHQWLVPLSSSGCFWHSIGQWGTTILTTWLCKPFDGCLIKV